MNREIVCLNLENEMDLVLANKRTMKLAEFCGLSITVQTALATAVSEIARYAIPGNSNALLRLGINSNGSSRKQITAVVCNASASSENSDAMKFARKLISQVYVEKNKLTYDVHLNQDLKSGGMVSDAKIDSFVEYFKSEPPLSPYDEIRRKNILLLEISGKLRESENQYRGLADSLPLMMFLANPQGEILYVNQWFRNYFGTSLTAVFPFADPYLVHQLDLPAFLEALDHAFRLNDPVTSQCRLKNRNGDFAWHMISIVPVKDDTGQVSEWTGFFVDIHAQKMIEETLKDNVELKDAQRRLIEYHRKLEDKISELNVSNHDLEQFAYIASHDLQEPLRKIVTFSSILDGRLNGIDAESRLYFNKIISSSLRMKELINDVLDWSRMGRGAEAFEDIDLNTVVEIIKADFELLIGEKNAVIHTNQLPVVFGSKLQITQLFSNLISNAIKFCDSSPAVNIMSRQLSQDEVRLNPKLDSALTYAIISVSDNGIGFRPDYAEQIFKIFSRLNGRSQYAGTGIGLAICRKIMENHGGFITAVGNPGVGSTFTVVLPLNRNQPASVKLAVLS